MRWEDERYVRVYTRDTVDWQGLSFDAQALFILLLRKVDRAGLLDLGKPGKRGVAVAIGHAREWARLEPALEELLTDGCVRLVDDGRRMLVPNFLAAQEAKASDKSRQQKSRETARDVAAAGHIISRDESSHGVTDSHISGQNVTTGHATSRPVTPSRAVPSRAEPFTASQGSADASPPADDLPDATDDAHPVAPAANGCPDCTAIVACWKHLPRERPGEKPPRKPSKAEATYEAMQAARKARCEGAGEAFVDDRWDAPRINRELGALVKGTEEDRERFEAAFAEFLADDSRAKQGWALSYFMKGSVRSMYENRALRAQQGAA